MNILIILLISFAYRFAGLTMDPPFWVDEFSTADQARLFLEYGAGVFQRDDVMIESHNFTTHLLTALSFAMFGLHEWAARLPFVIIGSCVPALVYILAKSIFDKRVALVSSLLTLFSYFMITWSRQARGYVIIQAALLVSMYAYFRLLSKEKSVFHLILLVLSILIGIITHTMFLFVVGAMIFHYSVFSLNKLRGVLKNIWIYGAAVAVLLILTATGSLQSIIKFYGDGTVPVNNVWYYHSFLWREYSLVTFLSLAGLIIGYVTNKKVFSLLILYTAIHLFFFSFLIAPYTSRYLLPIFPIMFMAIGYGVVYMIDLILKNQKIEKHSPAYYIIPLLVILFIIINGDKFVRKPKKYYTVNHDFREIANIDYHQIYAVVTEKGELEKEHTAVIDPWSARADWYIPRDYPAQYVFRWQNEPDRVNGLPKQTDFIYNTKGEKIIPHQGNLRFIGELADLKKAMRQYPKGFIFIDDTSMPRDVIQYAENNFKKEIVLDHYTLDENPYSLWPATLYSWGI